MLDKINRRLEKKNSEKRDSSQRLIGLISAFTRSFPAESVELGASPDYLPDLRDLYKKLVKDDLPKFETRFQDLLRKGTINDVVLFKNKLEAASNEIVDKITLINQSLRVCNWFVHHDEADRYFIRELPIRVHTKFVEQHKSILNELLTYLLPPSRVRSAFTGNREHNFEKRFGLKYDETLIRIRSLDRNMLPGVEDISIKHSVFAQTPLPEAQGIITENKMTFLTLPTLANTFALFGGGFNIDLLREAHWLRHKHLYYWGDLDAHGLVILSQLRQLFAHVDSLMMDRATFDAFYAGDHGPPVANVSTDGLREDEQELFQYLKEHNLRLEQEKIPHAYAVEQISRAIGR